MASAFRFGDPSRSASSMGRTRTGLAGVGNSSGGTAPYQLAALQPGARGYWASAFGMAPTAGGEATPETKAPTEEKKAETPATAPAEIDPSAGAAARGGNMAEGSGGNAIGGDPMGPAAELGGPDGLNISGADLGRVGGAILGGVAGGPVGAVLGGLAGWGLGKAYDGMGMSSDGMASGTELAGLGAQAQSNTEAMAGAMGGPGGYGDARGLAQGGRVTPAHLQHGKAAMQQHSKKSGLRSVGAGGNYMGGFADGGFVDQPDYSGQPTRQVGAPFGLAIDVTRGGPGAPTGAMFHQPLGGPGVPVYSYSGPSAAAPSYDTRINSGNLRADIWSNVADRFGLSGPTINPGPVEQLLASRPDLIQALIEQQGSVHPVNPANPSTGFLGAYSQGGRVPNYAEGGPVIEGQLAGPNPPGQDDGFAALDGGEFVVQAAQAQRPDYAPILQAMNDGTYEPDADDGVSGPPVYNDGTSIEDGNAGSRITTLDAPERQALMVAMQQDPVLAEAIMDLLGPEGMAMLNSIPPQQRQGVDSQTFQSQRAPLAGPPIQPGTAAPPGFPPPSQRPRGGLASVGA